MHFGFFISRGAFQPDRGHFEDAHWCVIVIVAALAAKQRLVSWSLQVILITVLGVLWCIGAFFFQGNPYHVHQETLGDLSKWITLRVSRTCA